MKTKLGLVLIISFLTLLLRAEVVSEEIKVFGNCEKCEMRIEMAASSVDGVLKADWSAKTNILQISYVDTIAESKEIHTAISKAGHDTDLIFANDADYDMLPMCCKYDRPIETIYGVSRVVSVPPGCNPKKMSTHTNSCCNENQ
jgi:copper chaperone CopZ